MNAFRDVANNSAPPLVISGSGYPGIGAAPQPSGPVATYIGHILMAQAATEQALVAAMCKLRGGAPPPMNGPGQPAPPQSVVESLNTIGEQSARLLSMAQAILETLG